MNLKLKSCRLNNTEHEILCHCCSGLRILMQLGIASGYSWTTANCKIVHCKMTMRDTASHDLDVILPKQHSQQLRVQLILHRNIAREPVAQLLLETHCGTHKN